MKSDEDASLTEGSSSPTEKENHAVLLQTFTDTKQQNKQTNKKSDKSERILLVETTIDNMVFVLINIYIANTGLIQLENLSDLGSILDKIKDSKQRYSSCR